MRFKADVRLLGRILGVIISTAVVAGCGDSSSDPSSSTTSSTSSGGTSASTTTALVALSSADYTVAPSANAVVTIRRSGPSTGSATVGYTTVNGTATSGTDYVSTSGTVTWDDGDSSAKTVTVPVMSAAAGKNFGFALTSVEGQADFGSPAAATVAISAASSSSSSSSSSSGGSSSSGATPPSASDSVTLSWSAPTENTDGTPLTNLAGFNIYYGPSAVALTNKISITNVGLLTYVVSNLTAGTWFFEVIAVNSQGIESNPSGVASTTIS